MASSFLSFSLLFITVYTADGFMEAYVHRCEFNSTELGGIQFIFSIYHNKLEHIRFDSVVGKFVGYTEFGVKQAEAWNKDTAQLATWRAQRGTYCQPNIGVFYQVALTKSGEFVFDHIKPR
ncbi:DLA class II histocompatibility antigen, DR-1 beta chain-like [Thunnus thynnus]|uniref:DLA class II histocompatibility antigen, DR-1 beta chain-like n=1 Tax=Thunnus thynnus TaxID=8237 RepID=UPI003527BE2C